jgi:hypothetical protein
MENKMKEGIDKIGKRLTVKTIATFKGTCTSDVMLSNSLTNDMKLESPL